MGSGMDQNQRLSLNSAATIRGQLERITFANEENGFTVAKLKVAGHRHLITVVGELPGVIPGEILELTGEWHQHAKFGQQFKVAGFRSLRPSSVVGIEKYLGSGLIKGIGPVMAKRLVKGFGADTLKVIDTEIDRLAEVEGIGEKRIQMIRDAWRDQREIREVMVFLQGHGISVAYATKIFKQYGRNAVLVVRENPYRLASDIHGIGFVTADKIAQNLGFDKDSELRAEAGILYVLFQQTEEGHVFLPYRLLLEECKKVLDVEEDVIAKGVERLLDQRRVVVQDEIGPQTSRHKSVYLAGYHAAEENIAKKMTILFSSPAARLPIDSAKALEWAEARQEIRLTAKQREAVSRALQDKVLVLTGGPGTGKTTILKVILEIYRPMTPKIVLGAPTGRAAKRLQEATGWEAKTIHRLLEWDFRKMGFRKDQDNPLRADLVIIDEASMIDELLMHHFLKAVPETAVLVLVGDTNQLPSVGAGNVLHDIIVSHAVPVVQLDEIFRQALGSLIVTNAHRINRGEFPKITTPEAGRLQDFYFIQKEDPEDVAATIVDLVTDRIPRRFGLDVMQDIQVLTPMHRGVIGAVSLNGALQAALNHSPIQLWRGGQVFKPGDKVMQIRNDYDKEVFNGDIGRIVRLDFETQNVEVDFEDRVVDYDFADLDALVLAYAVSIHKSQGSEYPAVVIAVHTSHYVLLQRNLIYTAVTRARKLAVVVGTKKALSIGIRNYKTTRRFTGLADKLKRRGR
jgi:exodeoxyribonuclease V alpha subunit